jgi:hypothetical protein
MNSQLAQPLVSGAAATIGAYIFVPEIQQLTLPGLNSDVNGPLAIGITTAAASWIGNMVSNYATPYIPDSRYSGLASTLLPPVATGAIAGGLVVMGDRTGGGAQAFNASKVGMVAFGAHIIGNEVQKAWNSNV